MLIAFTSDTHNQVRVGNEAHEQLFHAVRYADIIIHCGDATSYGHPAQIAQFSDWFRRLPPKHKIFVPGNHDLLFEQAPVVGRHCIHSSIQVVINELVVIEGIRIYGSPVTPTFGDWAFMRGRGEPIKRVWDFIPPCDILVTHGPPHGKLDLSVYRNEHAGCEELREAVKRIKPRVHAFGHIHNGYGSLVDYDDIMYINAACCNEEYKPVNPPLLVDWKERSAALH